MLLSSPWFMSSRCFPELILAGTSTFASYVVVNQISKSFFLYLSDQIFLFEFQRTFGVSTLEKTAHDDFRKLASAIYLQVSIISQALIFVTRSRSWSYVERPGVWLVVAFIIAQLVSVAFHFTICSQHSSQS